MSSPAKPLFEQVFDCLGAQAAFHTTYLVYLRLIEDTRRGAPVALDVSRATVAEELGVLQALGLLRSVDGQTVVVIVPDLFVTRALDAVFAGAVRRVGPVLTGRRGEVNYVTWAGVPLASGRFGEYGWGYAATVSDRGPGFTGGLNEVQTLVAGSKVNKPPTGVLVAPP